MRRSRETHPTYKKQNIYLTVTPSTILQTDLLQIVTADTAVNKIDPEFTKDEVIIDSDVADEESMTYFMEENEDVWFNNGGNFNVSPSTDAENQENVQPQPKKQRTKVNDP